MLTRYLYLPFTAAMGAILCLPQPALAQKGSKPLGILSATIGGQAYAGHTLEHPSEGTSTANFRSIGPATQITVQAHDPKTKSAMHNVVTLDMTVMGKNAAATVTSGSVSWWPKGMRQPFYINEGNETNTMVEIETLNLNDSGQITGRFSSMLCKKTSMFAAVDTSDCLPIKGTFETTLRDSG